MGYGFSSVVPSSCPFLIYGTYGLCVGFGIGLVYNIWLHTVMQWFPNHSGIASGLLLLGMGLSGVTTTPLAALLASTMGWRCSFRAICGILAVVGIAVLQFIRPAPEVDNIKSDKIGKKVEIASGQMIRCKAFGLFAVWKLIVIGLGQACSGQLAQIFKDFGKEESLQLFMVSLYIGINGTARLVWGFSCDRIGCTSTMLLVSVLVCLGCRLVTLGFPQGQMGMLVPGFFLIALCYGGAATLGANYIASVFGRKNYRRNNGISAATALPANLGATAAISVVRDISGRYLEFFWFAFSATLASILFAWLCRVQVNRGKVLK